MFKYPYEFLMVEKGQILVKVEGRNSSYYLEEIYQCHIRMSENI